jgi:hypothetical protein
MKQEETEQASSASVNFKELRSRNKSEHSMGPAGYTVKLEQWEEEDIQLAATGIPNPYDAYTNDRSKNLLRARSKLVIKDRIAADSVQQQRGRKNSYGHQGEDYMCRIFRNDRAEGV